ncbi:MAG: ABC transporter permease [Pseudomonadota bacterium]
MRLFDLFSYSSRALFAVRLRNMLILLAMSIGVASVIILTSLGEAARGYVVSKFSSLGTNLLIVLPGRSETTGSMPPLLGATPRDLTLDDARALLNSRFIKDMAPIVVGNAPVSRQEREREVSILGTSASFLAIRQLTMLSGHFLPDSDLTKGQSICVIGQSLAAELFGTQSPIGKIIRIGDSRFRILGLLSPAGISIGVDLDDLAVIPVANAQSLFNTESLFRIIVEARDRDAILKAKTDILRIIKERHDGEDDVTVITQDAVLSTFDRIFTALNLTVGGIAFISLLVAGILIMNVMLVSVSQRKSEIGLLKALGTPSRQILFLFLAEAGLLSLCGAVLGTVIGLSANGVLQRLFPDFVITPPPWAVGCAVLTALFTGLLFAALPAGKAASLEPVTALSRR